MSKRFATVSAPVLLFFVALSTPRATGQSPAPASGYPPVVHMTAEEDHARTMDLLNMRLIRLGKDGNASGAFPANYDESKANPFPIPDPLALDGKKKTRVTNAKMWWEKRRPQIVEAFDREVYGRVPANAPQITWKVTATRNGFDGDTPIKTETLVGHADNSAYPLLNVDIQLELTVPTESSKAVPVIINFDKAIPHADAGATNLIAVKSSAPTWQHQILARGWGYAILSTQSIQADSGDGLTEGIIGLSNHGQPRKLDDWGALRAWAWGASRALDYLATDSAVDAKHVGVEGHSRYGKAALVAMAYDPRFSIAYISSSGEGGAKLSRRNWGEALENVTNTAEYHWMAGNFLRYAGPLEIKDLPVDAHELIALCAPRPVFIGGGVTDGDGWADSKGMFLAEVNAGPVYTLLGKKDLTTVSFPSTETPLIAGDLAFRQHSGGHTPEPNWPVFLTFADRYLGPNPPNSGSSSKQVITASNR